jgi:DNA gyrase/topoisomerase IV subunit B
LRELFIVEGKSAASTLRQAIHKPDQSVLAIQGKLINAAKATPEKVLANHVCQAIFQSLGCGIKKHCNPNHLMFSHILILMDPDADGTHARVLLLALFDHYLKPLLDAGSVSIIIPPLFRITQPKTAQSLYAWNEQQRIALINNMTEYNNIEVTRFKGVAQFSTDECIKLLTNPDTRKQIDIYSPHTKM